MSSSAPTDAVTSLVERMNHLESLLVSNLLGFLLTTTITIFGAAYETRSGAKTPPFVTPVQMFVGASVVYVFLSGYYYFMLAQFYACVITLIHLVKSLDVKIDTLWTTLQAPSFGIVSNRIANIVMLAIAPLLPISFSTLSLIALRFATEGHEALGVGAVPTAVGISLQFLTCIFIITQPFLAFIKATTGASDEARVTTIKEPYRETESQSKTGSAPPASESPAVANPTPTQTEQV
jgi:hypothetical protein